MPTFDAIITGKITLPEVSTGPLPPGEGSPPGIWGGGNVPFPTPPIYIPVPPPTEEGGATPEHPIYIPVYPTHPIVIPVPPEMNPHPEHPIAYPPLVWPPLPAHPIAPGGPPPGIWPSPGHPAHPIAPGGPPPGPSQGPGFVTPPIYIPIPQPPGGEYPEHPIYFPVSPTHPIVLPPEGGTPELPPAFVSPPTGAPGFWGYSFYYQSMVFVPYDQGTPPANPAAPDQTLPGDLPTESRRG
jgi:hypothetical protein